MTKNNWGFPRCVQRLATLGNTSFKLDAQPGRGWLQIWWRSWNDYIHCQGLGLAQNLPLKAAICYQGRQTVKTRFWIASFDSFFGRFQANRQILKPVDCQRYRLYGRRQFRVRSNRNNPPTNPQSTRQLQVHKLAARYAKSSLHLRTPNFSWSEKTKHTALKFCMQQRKRVLSILFLMRACPQSHLVALKFFERRMACWFPRQIPVVSP